MSVSRSAPGVDWRVRTYHNKQTTSDVTQHLYSLLYAEYSNTVLADGDVIYLDDHLDMEHFGNRHNGVNDNKTISIRGLYSNVNGQGAATGGDMSLTFINSLAIGRELYIASTPSDRYGLFNVGWHTTETQTTNAYSVWTGHLRIAEPSPTANTILYLKNGNRVKDVRDSEVAFDVSNDDLLVEGYYGFNSVEGGADTRYFMNGGGALRVVGYSGRPYATAQRGVGANIGTIVKFQNNKGKYGGAVFAKEQHLQSGLDDSTLSLVLDDQGFSNGLASLREEVRNWFPYLTETLTFEKAAYFDNNTAVMMNNTTNVTGANTFTKDGGDGGGLYVSQNGSVVFFAKEIYEDYCDYLGMSQSDHPLGTSYGANFTGNVAENSGGAIAVSSNGSIINFGGSFFTNNTARGTDTSELTQWTQAHADARDTYYHAGAGGAIYIRDDGVVALVSNTYTSTTTSNAFNTFGANTAQGTGGVASVHNAGHLLLSGEFFAFSNKALGDVCSADVNRNVTKRNGAVYEELDAAGNVILSFLSQPAEGYGGAFYIRGDDERTATITLMEVCGYIGADARNPTQGANTHGSGQDNVVNNSFFLFENAHLEISPEKSKILAIYDPIASRGLEWGGGTDWVLENGGEHARNNHIYIGFIEKNEMDLDRDIVRATVGTTKTVGTVWLWGDSSDDAFLDTNQYNANGTVNTNYDRLTGGETTTFVDVDGTDAYGYYGNTTIRAGKLELMDGRASDATADETVKMTPNAAVYTQGPTQYGSNRTYEDATSGNITIGVGHLAGYLVTEDDTTNGTTDNGTTDNGTAGTEIATLNAISTDLLATVVLHKYTVEAANIQNQEYTTLRANSLTMDGGVLEFAGYKPNIYNANIDRKNEASLAQFAGMALSDIFSATGEYANNAGDDTAKLFLGPNGQINLVGVGIGHGGTFNVGELQEYNLYLGMTGDGNFTKAGTGLLNFHSADYDTTGAVVTYGRKTYTGLTVISGGTLRFDASNTLAELDLDATGGIQVDGRGHVLNREYSEGVVLVMETATAINGEVVAPVLDLERTLVVDSQGADVMYDLRDGVLTQRREQTLGALAGCAESVIMLNNATYTGIYQGEVVLTISNGWDWTPGTALEDNFLATRFEGAEKYDHYFSGTIAGGGKLVKRGKGFLGLAGRNELTRSTELQGGGLYLGHELALSEYDETVSLEQGLIEVFGADDKYFGIRADKDYALQVRLVADAGVTYSPTLTTLASGALSIDSNTRVLTFEGLSTDDDGAVINMKSVNEGYYDRVLYPPNAAVQDWTSVYTLYTAADLTDVVFTGADLIFLETVDPETDRVGGYVFQNNISNGKGGAIYAGGDLTLVGNTRFSNNQSRVGAVYLAGTNITNVNSQLRQTVLLYAGQGDIAFEDNNVAFELGGSVSLAFAGNIDLTLSGANNIYFDASIKSENLTSLIGGVPVAVSNDLTMQIAFDNRENSFAQFLGGSNFAGQVTVSNGTLRTVGSYFTCTGTLDTTRLLDPTTGAIVQEGTLAGSGIIEAGGMSLAGRISPDSDRFAIPNSLTEPVMRMDDRIAENKRRGILTLRAPSIEIKGTYAVDLDYNLAAERNQNGHISDVLDIEGRLTIDKGAVLEINPMRMNFGAAFTNGALFNVIEADTQIDGSTFQISYTNALPRFLKLSSHGLSDGKTRYYLEFGKSGWLFSTPAETRNQKAVGEMLNALIPAMHGYDQEIKDTIYNLSILNDEQVRNALQEISPDIRANSLALGHSEPWRPIFERMNVREPGYPYPPHYLGQYRVPFKTRPREIWFNSYYRGMDTYGDGNARTYGISRTGFILGIEKEVHDDIRFGLIFGYAAPYLFQDSGKVEANDFQGGLYTLFHLPKQLEFRAYVGMNILDYDYRRYENLFGTGRETYRAKFDGDGMGVSVELSRPFRWGHYILLRPLAAFDYQYATQDAFVENGGSLCQNFDKADFSQSTLRFGLGMNIGETEDMVLTARVQYGVRLNDTAPQSVSSLVGIPNAPEMRIDGISLGSNYVNLGLGTRIALNPKRTSKFFLNYDADITERAIVNTGSAGLTFQF